MGLESSPAPTGRCVFVADDFQVVTGKARGDHVANRVVTRQGEEVDVGGDSLLFRDDVFVGVDKGDLPDGGQQVALKRSALGRRRCGGSGRHGQTGQRTQKVSSIVGHSILDCRATQGGAQRGRHLRLQAGPGLAYAVPKLSWRNKTLM